MVATEFFQIGSSNGYEAGSMRSKVESRAVETMSRQADSGSRAGAPADGGKAAVAVWTRVPNTVESIGFAYAKRTPLAHSLLCSSSSPASLVARSGGGAGGAT